MPATPVSGYLQAKPTAQGNTVLFPVFYMRGGTSTGIVMWEDHFTGLANFKEDIIRKIMGVPDTGERKGNKQITGLGRGVTTSNKVFIVEPHADQPGVFKTTLAQLAADKAAIDWSVNCGNMSAAIPLYLMANGLVKPKKGVTQVSLFNTSTQVTTDCRVPTPTGRLEDISLAEIPGVMGAFPGVELSLRNPIGAKTGQLLPTGSVKDIFDGIEASCVDVAVPMIILKAEQLGLQGDESIDSLNANKALIERLRSIWVQAGLKMALKTKSGNPMTAEQLAASETIPKVCFVSKPNQGGHVRVRYFTPQQAHNSLAVTGGCCLAAACLIPGTTAHDLAEGLDPLTEQRDQERMVAMENPAGILRARVFGRAAGAGPGNLPGLALPWTAYERSAQIFMQGYAQIYNASNGLIKAVRAIKP
jgi:4-oxalomesaconate tautomerase